MKNYMKNIVSFQYWSLSYENLDLKIALPEDGVRRFIEDHLTPQRSDLSCFEFGIYPGRYAAVFGNLGYELNGVDQIPYTQNRLPQWFSECAYTYNYLGCESIENLNLDRRFDLVYSIGFIEHFKDYKNIIDKHLDLLSDDGVLFISTPNFRGVIQFLLHLLIDKKNLDRHVIESMNPKIWKEQLIERGLNVISYGYFHGFDFWVDNQSRNIFQRVLKKCIFKILPILKHVFKNNSAHYSPYCYILAKKN